MIQFRQFGLLFFAAIFSAQPLLAATLEKTNASVYFYNTTISQANQQQSYQWSIIRSPNQVRINKEKIYEVWLNNKGNISLISILPDKNIGIEYSHSELASSGQQADWQTITSSVTDSLRQTLVNDAHKSATTEVLSMPATVYQNNTDNEEVRLTLLNSEQALAALTINNKQTNQRIDTTLVKIEDVQLEGVDQWLRNNNIRVYDHADIGDEENANESLTELLKAMGESTDAH